MVKRILRQYGYPPDMQETATETVLQQAELSRLIGSHCKTLGQIVPLQFGQARYRNRRAN